MAALELHEKEYKEYLKHTGQALGDAARFNSLKSLVPKVLEEESGKLRGIKFAAKGETGTPAYDEAKVYVISQLQMAREPFFTKLGK